MAQGTKVAIFPRTVTMQLHIAILGRRYDTYHKMCETASEQEKAQDAFIWNPLLSATYYSALNSTNKTQKQ